MCSLIVPKLNDAATVGITLLDIYSNFTRMVQYLDFTTISRAHKEYCLNMRSSKHISRPECYLS